MSIDENDIARLERISFDAYNEADVLTNAIENYRQRIGHYPERVLVDQIYRNQTSRACCKEYGILISGPALGRPEKMTPKEREQACGDNIDGIGVERGFSLEKKMLRTRAYTNQSIDLELFNVHLAGDPASEINKYA